MAEQELKDPLEQKYADSLNGLPRFKCGRLDMNTYLPDPVRVGRVESDVVRYIYFDDGEEAIVLGQRADEIAFAAAQYHALTARLSSAEAEVERLRAIMLNLVRAMENEIDTRRCRASSLHALNLARKEANTAAARRQQGGTDAR